MIKLLYVENNDESSDNQSQHTCDIYEIINYH